MAGRASDLLQSIGLKFDGSSPSGQCALIVIFGLLNPTDGELAIRAAVAKEVGPGMPAEETTNYPNQSGS